jgi:hypothetical protein
MAYGVCMAYAKLVWDLDTCKSKTWISKRCHI